MTSRSRVIPANQYRRLRWANHAGWTREIHAEPGADSWRWRISIAELEAVAPFSRFPGVERELVLLRGEGLQLRFEDESPVELDPPHGRLRFDGGRALAGEPRGRCEVFNLMWHRDAASAQLWHRPLAGPMLVFVDPGSTWIVHLLGGHARIGGDAALPALATGDTALLAANGERTRYVIEGGGEALLVRINGPTR
ncbi:MULTISPECIES: HutD/Ves family protein [unclassified Luteimonas]